MKKVMNEEHPLRRRELRGIGSLKRKMLQFARALGMERVFDRPLGTSKEEENYLDAPPVYSYSKQIESALLEAERKKAEALMDWERHRVSC